MKFRSLLVTGARVYTADPASPWGEALLTDGESIAYVGAEQEARAHARPGTEEIHVPGGLVVPGLNDSHIHMTYGARALSILSLEGVRSIPELQRRLREYAGRHQEGEWLEGYGLAYEVFAGSGRTEREVIDDAVPDRPIYLRCLDYHTAWSNSVALKRAGIERGANLPAPSEVVVDRDSGLATGMLKENPATDLVSSLLPVMSTAQSDRALREAIRYVNRLGITSVQNMDGDTARLEQYTRLADRGELTLRASHYLRFPHDRLLMSLPELRELARDYSGPWNRVAGLKLFIDGVMEAKTAWMAEPYADGSGQVGAPAMDPDLYRAATDQADALGISVATHAVGDYGVHAALDAYAAARRVRASGRKRHRIEHIEVVLPSDVARFGELDVVASMQPYHATPTSDPRFTPWTKMAGPRREPYSFAWRSLLEAGARLAFGSDWPIVTPDVRVGIRTAIARTSSDGEPTGGWQPQLTITVAQALDAYTRIPAFAEAQEGVKGMLRRGMAADVSVFARDLFTLTPEELPDAGIAVTVVGGRPVHREV